MSGWMNSRLIPAVLNRDVTGRQLVPSSLASADVIVVLAENRSVAGSVGRRVLGLGQKCMSVFGLGALAFGVAMMLNPSLRLEMAAQLSPPDASAAFTVDSGDDKIPAAQAVGDAPGTLMRVTWSVPGTVQSIADIASRVPMSAIDSQARQTHPDSAQTQSLVAEYVAKRYRLAVDASRHIVAAAYQAGKETGLDPLLILGIMAIESSFNPLAESSMGAQGLMQVMTRVHQEKYHRFGGTKAALDPFVNIKVGALVLRDCITRGGSLTDGLRMYVGSTTSGDGGYGAKVLSERARLQDVAQGKRVPLYAAAPSPAQQPAKPTVPSVKPGADALDEASTTNSNDEGRQVVAAAVHGA